MKIFGLFPHAHSQRKSHFFQKNQRKQMISSIKNYKIFSLIIFTIFFLCNSTTLLAQSTTEPPLINAKDLNSVNMASGAMDFPGPQLNIGGDGSNLSYTAAYGLHNWQDYTSYSKISVGGGNYQVAMNVSYNGSSYRFYVGFQSFMSQGANNWQIIAGPYNDTKGNAKFACDSYPATYHVSGNCSLYLDDGTKVNYIENGSGGGYHVVGSVEKPDGELITLTYPGLAQPYVRTVSSSLGWMLKMEGGFYVTKVTASNMSDTYCDPIATSCSVGTNYPYATVSGMCAGSPSTPCIIYQNGILAASYSYSAGATPITTPSCTDTPNVGTYTITTPSGRATTAKISYYCAFDSHNKISSVIRGGQTWTYTYALAGSGLAATSQNPLSGTNKFTSSWWGQVLSRTDELNRITSYQWNTSGNGANATLASSTSPAGNYTTYLYNADRSQIQATSVPNGAETNIVTSATFTSPCDTTNYKTCHKPLTTKDGLGNEATYTYASSHGGVLTETGPADASGVRPQTRYTYTQLYPKILNASGVPVNSTPVWRLTKTSSCRSATPTNPASCVGSDQETVTEYEYASNNLLMTKTTVRAGNANVLVAATPNNVWAETKFEYDTIGNTVSVDGPLPGTVDKSYTTYDVLRRKVLEIGADPDGTSALKRQIVWHKYDVDSREYRTELGTCADIGLVNGIPTGCSSYVLTSYTERTYDATTGLEVKSITVVP